MTKKDYVLIAETINTFVNADLANEYGFSLSDRNSYEALKVNLIYRFANSLEKENDKFNRYKFYKACLLKI